jgi:hypothetical protein
MSMRARRRVLIASATGFIGVSLPSTSLAQRRGHAPVPAQGSAKVRVVRGRLSCRAARRQIAAAYRAEDTRHWCGYQNPYRVFWRVDGWRWALAFTGARTPAPQTRTLTVGRRPEVARKPGGTWRPLRNRLAPPPPERRTA